MSGQEKKPEYIVTTHNVVCIRFGPHDHWQFKHTGARAYINTLLDKDILYQWFNDIKAKYISKKLHYTTCKGKKNLNEYGLTMSIMDIEHIEQQHPVWCI